MWTAEEIKLLCQMFESSPVTEVSLGSKGSKITLQFAHPGGSTSHPSLSLSEKPFHVLVVESEWVGEFSTKDPTSGQPFVEAHDMVSKNTVIGRVRLVDLWKEVHAGVDGLLLDILPDSSYVQFGHAIAHVLDLQGTGTV